LSYQPDEGGHRADNQNMNNS